MAVKVYTESDERAFMLSLLHEKKYERAVAYCNLVLSGTRDWDETVDVPKVMATAEHVKSLAIQALQGVPVHPDVMRSV